MSIRIQHWETGRLEDHVALIKRQVLKSMEDPETRQLAARIVSGVVDWARDQRTGAMVPVISAWGRYFRAPPGSACPARDSFARHSSAVSPSEACEIQNLWDFVVLNVRYVEDPVNADLYAAAKITLEAGAGDCFEEGTLLLTDAYEFVAVESLRPGTRIWGFDKWSRVEACGPRGVKPVTAIFLNNGSTVKLTEEHKVYVALCDQHRHWSSTTQPCSCPVSERRVERIRVSELEAGMVLLAPEALPFGAEAQDPEMALLDGLYISDGWCDANGYRFSISGKDGFPKEDQKRLVEEICAKRDIKTRWHERYLAVNDSELTHRMQRMGSRAWDKHALSLNLNEPAAAALLDGIMADSGANTNGAGRTFTSTSRLLALQTRVLQKMFGVSCGYSYIENHGGLGKHPIYRLSTRGVDGARAPKLLRVKDIQRNVYDAPTWDIQTDDHYVYLPEHDVTVSNCDDFVVLFAALFMSIGYNASARVLSVDGQYWAHIYTLIHLPKVGHLRYYFPLDPTEPSKPVGWHYPNPAAQRDFQL